MWRQQFEVDLGPNKQRGVLAALAIRPGAYVPRSTVISRVWGDEPPARARELLYNYVTALRAKLRYVPGISITSRGGYQVRIAPDAVDVCRFRDGIARARQAPQRSQAELNEKVELLRAGLAHWRDEPLSGLDGEWFAGIRTALELQRATALVERFEFELRLGRHAAVVDELAELHADTPWSEPMAALLMRALYQSGFQLDALRVFRETRHVLAEVHGVEPSEKLRQVHNAVLSGVPIA